MQTQHVQCVFAPPSTKEGGEKEKSLSPFLGTDDSDVGPASVQDADTVFFHPVGKQTSLLSLSKETIVAQLSSIDGAHRICVNF